MSLASPPAAGQSPATLIYKILPASLWRDTVAEGRLDGAPVDIEDGFIHFSTAAQVRETAARHFAGQADLMLIGVAIEALGDALRWEPSRGGDLFPHLYAPLDLSAVRVVEPLDLDDEGAHRFPPGFP